MHPYLSPLRVGCRWQWHSRTFDLAGGDVEHGVVLSLHWDTLLFYVLSCLSPSSCTFELGVPSCYSSGSRTVRTDRWMAREPLHLWHSFPELSEPCCCLFWLACCGLFDFVVPVTFPAGVLGDGRSFTLPLITTAACQHLGVRTCGCWQGHL